MEAFIPASLLQSASDIDDSSLLQRALPSKLTAQHLSTRQQLTAPLNNQAQSVKITSTKRQNSTSDIDSYVSTLKGSSAQIDSQPSTFIRTTNSPKPLPSLPFAQTSQPKHPSALATSYAVSTPTLSLPLPSLANKHLTKGHAAVGKQHDLTVKIQTVKQRLIDNLRSSFAENLADDDLHKAHQLLGLYEDDALVEVATISPAKQLSDASSPYRTTNTRVSSVKTPPSHLHQVRTEAFATSTYSSETNTRPASRRDVIALQIAMQEFLVGLGVAGPDDNYPSEMQSFLQTVLAEQQIYDIVLQELSQQLTVTMIERGEIMSEIRKRYANLFRKMPSLIKTLHSKLQVQQKISQRLSEELVHAKDVTGDLAQELDSVRRYDHDNSMLAQTIQHKLVTALTHTDASEEELSEYHRLYKMQRDRLNVQIRNSETERQLWLDAAVTLSMRIGQEHGISELAELQKSEGLRMRSCNHLISLINSSLDSEFNQIRDLVEMWRARIVKLSQVILEDDVFNLSLMTRTLRDIKFVHKQLLNGDASNTPVQSHPILQQFQEFDGKSVCASFEKWLKDVNEVSSRFTSDQDIVRLDAIFASRKSTDEWTQSAAMFLIKCESTSNGLDYAKSHGELHAVAEEVAEWLRKLKLRVSGEDGVASAVISLQNQLEDRYSAFSARNFKTALTVGEQLALKTTLEKWIKEFSVVIACLSKTTEDEQRRIPLRIENWQSKIMDLLNTDVVMRGEGMARPGV